MIFGGNQQRATDCVELKLYWTRSFYQKILPKALPLSAPNTQLNRSASSNLFYRQSFQCRVQQGLKDKKEQSILRPVWFRRHISGSLLIAWPPSAGNRQIKGLVCLMKCGMMLDRSDLIQLGRWDAPQVREVSPPSTRLSPRNGETCW